MGDGHCVRWFTQQMQEVGGNLLPLVRQIAFVCFYQPRSSPFSIDDNGTLTTIKSLDYEADDRNYTITVRVKDDHNASYDKNFSISITNVVEDLDGDGTEDHYDDDIDGDGLTNAEELAYNSDPWDASSSNRPPSDINASNLTIAENSAVGTIIGEFNATDPDGGGNFTYLLSVPEFPQSLQPLFWLDSAHPGSLWQDTAGTNSSGDNKPVALWKDRSGNGFDVVQSNSSRRPTFKSSVPSLNNLGAVSFNDDYLTRSQNLGINGNHDLTLITVWVNAGNTGANYQHLIHFGSPQTRQAYGHSVYKGSIKKIGNHYYNKFLPVNQMVVPCFSCDIYLRQ